MSKETVTNNGCKALGEYAVVHFGNTGDYPLPYYLKARKPDGRFPGFSFNLRSAALFVTPDVAEREAEWARQEVRRAKMPMADHIVVLELYGRVLKKEGGEE